MKDLSEWKSFIINKEKDKSLDPKAEFSIIIIDDNEIIGYAQDDAQMAGMWYQDDKHKIYIYSKNSNHEHFSKRIFEGEGCGPIHFHNCIEIGYVLKGCAKQMFYGKLHEFKEGEFWILDQDTYHCDVYHDDELFTIYVSIAADIFDKALLNSLGDSKFSQFLGSAISYQKKHHQFVH
ncbi:MAG: AraC family ligand binding domain-containing protein, partial [Holdemanella sp.]|nr:AraC family ligand binding domain-containing protein [Holdemanella sp.]